MGFSSIMFKTIKEMYKEADRLQLELKGGQSINYMACFSVIADDTSFTGRSYSLNYCDCSIVDDDKNLLI